MSSESIPRSTTRLSLAVGFSLALTCTVLALFSTDFWGALEQFFIAPFSNRYFFGNFLADAVPLAIAGLGVLIAFKSKNFNLGGEGQLYSGALVAGILALSLGVDMSPLELWFSVSIAGAFAGLLIAAISGVLKAYRGVSEMISSFLISAIMVNVVDFFVTGPLQDPSSNFQTTRQLATKLLLPKILAPSKLDVSVLVALALVVGAALAASHTRVGFELKICGENEEFARYCGIPVAGYNVGAMAISGALHGLAGALLVIGPQTRVMRGFSGGIGWSAISVALLAQGSELGIVPAALFVAFLDSGSNQVMIGSGIPSEIISILQAAALFFITAQALPHLKRRRNP